MWSNFTDFALKAQKDLQDQANEAASKLQQQLPPISAPPVVGVTVPTMSSFFNLDSMQPSSSTTTTTFAQDPLPQSDDMIHNINHDITPPNDVISEQNVAIAEPTESVEEVPTPIDTVTKSDAMILTNDDDVIDRIENDTKMDDHGNRIPSNVESSIIEDVTIIPNQDTTTDDNDDDDDQTKNTNVELTMEQTEILVTTAPTTTTFPTTNVEESAPTTDTMVPSDIEETTTVAEPVVSFPVDDEQIHMDDHNHNHVPATTGTILVVEADEDTSHSMSIQDDNNNNNILSPIKELILPTTTKVGNNLNVTKNNETTQSHVESSVDQQQQHEKTNDDQSDATTATTAPQQENYIRQSKHQDITAVETIPEVIVSEVVDVDPTGIPSSTTTNNNNNMLSPMTPSPNISKQRPTKKLLLLISTNSIDRQVKVRQDLVVTALNAANIEYDVIDGSIHNDNNTTNITLRNELFALSGLRGIYPQFFIVNLLESHNINDRGDGTGTKFWGTFEEFQHVNDDGQLQQVFGSYSTTTSSSDSILESPDNKTITRNLYPSETLPEAAQPLHDKEGISVKEKSTTMTVPDDVYEKFSQQIQRIEENYQLERQETEQRHLQEIQNQQQLYEQCEQEKRELEEKLSNEIKQKDEQLQEMYRRNEGYRLKLDVLKREVTGTQELVQGRDQELQKASQKYLNDLRAMEKQFNNAEKSAIKFQEEVQIMQTKLDKSEAELLSSKQEYEAMKDRAKDVATELKHRRAECRQLQDSVAELTEQNNHLKSTVGSLEERLNHQGLNQSDKDKEIESLRAKLTEAQQELKNVETVWQEKLSKSENVLTEYKKRAQHSLSMSNSRTAAAVQAREEAELDARAARSTADAALERSVKAEVECREAIAKAKITVKAMEDERDEALRNLDQLKLQIVAAESMRVEKERDMESVMATLKNKNVEIEHLQKVMNEADAKIASMQHKIMESTNTIDDLREEIMALREELQRATISTANIVSVQINEDNSSGVKHAAPSSILQNGLQVDAEGDDTIATLRMELREANDAIEDLKSALKNAIELNEQQQRVASVSSSNLTGPDDSGRSDIGQTNSSDSGTIPLFYAMEKQAELKTARTEMNRLASLLADVQSEKMEAYDAMEEMRRKLDEAESRLKRNEKLGMIQSTTNSTIEAGNESSNASAVNIEYLKHILLRYMNAKTQTERKMLVPVIGAVLELTPDEVHAATQNIERNSASIVASNGNSLFSFLS